MSCCALKLEMLSLANVLDSVCTMASVCMTNDNFYVVEDDGIQIEIKFQFPKYGRIEPSDKT